ncbi:PAP-associated domain-containing protein [Aphelenchoides bicaudatus]|nr:PAP-associated domain-containing protein [Aphelenchoides bicaudatus]
MFCGKPFIAEKQEGYNERWGVVFNKQYATLNTGFYAQLTEEIEKVWQESRMTAKDRRLRDKFMEYLYRKTGMCNFKTKLFLNVFKLFSTCGTVSSDMDLCYVIKTSKVANETKYKLPIEKYSEEINAYIIDRINKALRDFKEIRDIDSRPARVPIVNFKMNTKDVMPEVEPREFDFDINCNCVAGIYNAYLLGGLANFDDRLPKLSIIIKKWAKDVKIVADYRFNSYNVVLLIVHYLQCGVNPPVLPNLMKLQPKDYDGETEPWNLTTSMDRDSLPEPENKMGVGALLCGFFRYYAQFDFNSYGILIRYASVIKMRDHEPFDGLRGSRMFVEEPYDGLTVPKNIKQESDFMHIRYEFKIAKVIMNSGVKEKTSLKALQSRQVPPGVATREDELEEAQARFKRLR